MRKRRWSRRVVVKYTLLQLPALTLLAIILYFMRLWVAIPAWLIGGIIALWVVKDVVLFFFVWRAYDQDRHTDANTMIGLRGIVKDRLAPSGYVEVHGELWRAEVMEGASPVNSGENIRVRGIRGLTLIVQPDK
jgi:membrane protein implicated in regulation of membrane protease activity